MTSPMLPPTPWKDSTAPRRWVKCEDSAAIAGRCHTDAAIATTAMPISNSAYPTGLSEVEASAAWPDATQALPGICQPAAAISSQPTPNSAMQAAMTQPQ